MRSFAVVLAATLVLAGCAGGGATRPDKTVDTSGTKEALQKRVEQRWAHLIKEDFDKAWEYLTPGYRSTASREVWASNMKDRPVKWTKAVVSSTDCPEGEEFCDVTVQVEFVANSSIPMVGQIEAATPVFERWIRLKGAWYHVPQEVARAK